MHGISLNIFNDLGGFKKIIPCGLKGKDVCCIEEFVPTITYDMVLYVLLSTPSLLSREQFLAQFEEVFQVQLFKGSNESPLDSAQSKPPLFVDQYYQSLPSKVK